jgi:hypothetical protein
MVCLLWHIEVGVVVVVEVSIVLGGYHQYTSATSTSSDTYVWVKVPVLLIHRVHRIPTILISHVLPVREHGLCSQAIHNGTLPRN